MVKILNSGTIQVKISILKTAQELLLTAIFEFNNQKVNIALKPEIAGQMRYEIKYGVTNYGLLSDKYWLYIEELAIKYWADFDRQEIFSTEIMLKMIQHSQQSGAIQFYSPLHPPCCDKTDWLPAESWPQKPPFRVQTPGTPRPHFPQMLLCDSVFNNNKIWFHRLKW